jgi:signal peptidase I
MLADSPQATLRQIARGAGWAALVAAVLLALAIALPLAVGDRPYTVLTGSMEPTISAGDVVIDERISPASAGVGDVVTFRDPEDQSRLITHRVRSIHRAGSHLWFVTQGDANNTTEHWRISAGGELGRVVYAVPWVGHVAAATHTPLGLGFLVVVPLLLLVFDELARIWRPPVGRVSGEAH